VETRYSGHTVYRTEYHIVWIPKYRRRILNSGVKRYLEKVLPKVLGTMPGCEMIEHNIQDDHIHMVMVIPPRYSVSEIVGRMKGMTASRLRARYEWLKKVYWEDNTVWSPGYFVTTIGIDEDKIRKYVMWQQSHDSGQAKLEL